jgi:probable phosphoglycerate mutase
MFLYDTVLGMHRVYLIRHGHVDNPRCVFYGPTFPLSDRGYRQINALANDMADAGIHPAAIISSPYLRTLESANIIAARFPDARQTMDNRLEEWRVNGWLDKPLEEFYAATGYREHPSSPLPPTVESLASCAARVSAVIREAIALHPHADICIVGHREPLAAAILTYQGLGFETIRTLSLPRASGWELFFEENEEIPHHAAFRFDRSSLE